MIEIKPQLLKAGGKIIYSTLNDMFYKETYYYNTTDYVVLATHIYK